MVNEILYVNLAIIEINGKQMRLPSLMNIMYISLSCKRCLNTYGHWAVDLV